MKYFSYSTLTISHSDTVISILSYINSSRNSNLNILKVGLVLLCSFNFHCCFLLSCIVYFSPINTDITNRAALFYIYYFSSFALKKFTSHGLVELMKGPFHSATLLQWFNFANVHFDICCNIYTWENPDMHVNASKDA